MPFISVIIPVYNVEKYVKRCVESLIHQEYHNFEIILTDDGSTDCSGEICDSLAMQYDNVLAVHKENGGLASARNYGMQRASGEYVVFVDSDDWVVSNYFEFLEQHLKNKPDVLKYGYQKIQNGKLGKITVPYFDEGLYDCNRINKDLLPGAIGPIRLFDYSKNALMSACTCAYSLKFLRDNNIIFASEREILNEDHLFNLHVMLCADTIEISHEVLYMYDFREGSLSKRYIQTMLNRKNKLLSEYKKLLVNYRCYDEYKTAYYNQCVDSYYACITNECGVWGEKSVWNISREVKNILNINECRIALKHANSKCIGVKGAIIYNLMRYRFSLLLCVLYRTMKR